ncbi:GntR family transcriptional regulator [Amycolatopsis sp. NPDC102389]|uniref:GntR family transcriptional regulator n=1 Tax=Amycolatopsis sp. NPDC102389 TaxID=3363941 RepID=UPI0037F2FC74
MIAADIRDRIDAGRLKPGDRVPSIRKISVEWQVAHATATKAMAILRAEGVVEAIPGAYTVVAGGPGGGRGRRDNSRERIVLAAIEIADAEGLDAVSMRAVAAKVDNGTMSLYHHVKGRSELVDLMAETALAGNTPVDDALRGRARLESAARSLWATYRRHPWLTRFDIGGLRALSWLAAHGAPVALGAAEQGKGSMTALHYWVLLHGLVRGLASDLYGEKAESGAPGRCEGEVTDLANEAEVIFDLGLRRLLDGVAFA